MLASFHSSGACRPALKDQEIAALRRPSASIPLELPSPASALEEDFKKNVQAHYDALAARRDAWSARNWFYHRYLQEAVARWVPPGRTVLELGSATGNLLAALRPAYGFGLDLSPAMTLVARRKYPGLRFEVGDAETFEHRRRFDFIVASDLVGELLDISAMLERAHAVSHARTRVVLTFHNPALEGLLRVLQRWGLAMPPARQNWIGPRDLQNLLALSDFEIEAMQSGLLVPFPLPLLAPLGNRYLSNLRGPRYFNVVNIVAARPIRPRPHLRPLSCTVVIPCRNEERNIEAVVTRMPPLGSHTELIFVDGASTDRTRERIAAMRRRYRGRKDIKLIRQAAGPKERNPTEPPRPVPAVHPDAPVAMLKLGKGDAVRKGFDAARGDVLMILDADLAVPPEDLPRFFAPLACGKARFINGSRLVYPMEERAMKFVNYLGNKFFSVLFTWLLEQPIRDTLCGTKALLREDYLRIRAGRAYFGDFDPFGDFDLLFGAARLGLKIAEVPVRYRRRVAGVSKVRIWRHGLLLAAMSLLAFRKLKLARRQPAR